MSITVDSRNAFRAIRLDVMDSPKRCPYDGKRMIMDVATSAVGEKQTIHSCLNCDYTEED